MENLVTGQSFFHLSILDDMKKQQEEWENLTEEERKQIEEEQLEREKEWEERERKQEEERHRRYIVEESGIKKRYWEESLDTYKTETEEDKKNLEYIRKFCKGETKPMLLLIGKYGTGKTHLGCGIVRETWGTFVSSFELCLRFEMGSDFKADMNKMEVLEKYSSKKMLVIDEIGRAKQDIEKMVIPYIINERYERMLPTVLITNIDKQAFLELLGDATTDRLKEVCSTLTFTGKSKRSGE